MTLIKSVSGVRGIARADTPHEITMDTQVAFRLGRAFAAYIGSELDTAGRHLIVAGRDGRAGGETLLNALAQGAQSEGVDLVDLGIVSTPGVALVVRAMGAAGGIVITASHNPAQWNGVKFMTAKGQAPTANEASAIFDAFDNAPSSDESIPEPVREPRQADLQPHVHHVEKVLRLVDADRIAEKRFTVVLDSINGAGAQAGRLLLEQLGCRVVHMNAEPAATFAHTPEPIEANLKSLCESVQREKAHVGFAQDPDADRLAIVDEKGRFIGEEYTLALCAKRVLERSPGPVAANLSTSRMIDDIASSAQCTVHRSAVGEANVVQVMHDMECVVGGEGNGGVIHPDVVYVRDSMTSMALVLDSLAASGRPLSNLVDGLPRYAMLKDKLNCDRTHIDKAIAAIRDGFQDGHCNDTDGLRIDWPDQRKWVHVRGSNTEPIIRAIVEAHDQQTAVELMQDTRRIIEPIVGT